MPLIMLISAHQLRSLQSAEKLHHYLYLQSQVTLEDHDRSNQGSCQRRLQRPTKSLSVSLSQFRNQSGWVEPWDPAIRCAMWMGNHAFLRGKSWWWVRSVIRCPTCLISWFIGLSQLLRTASNLIHAYGVYMLVLAIRIEYQISCLDIHLILDVPISSIQNNLLSWMCQLHTISAENRNCCEYCGRDTKVVLILRHAANVQASM